MTSCDCRPVAYVLILAGVALAGLTALVPQYAIGYRLEVGVLLAMLTPFVVYGALTESLRGAALLLPGLALLAVNAWLYFDQRLRHYDGFADGTVYWLPLAVAAVVLPIAWFARPRGD
ncbi:MAG: hypothetical protein NZ524_05315 [Thiobacillaceae bacterium]|nr:hypothetical protein [Thiobacillaceae bacterium]MCX7674195.1 hypothetical protein [Thiobacillaceae bacterium]MDW8322867.1 hypothetical protein [Burkholderiales bacterium]